MGTLQGERRRRWKNTCWLAPLAGNGCGMSDEFSAPLPRGRGAARSTAAAILDVSWVWRAAAGAAAAQPWRPCCLSEHAARADLRWPRRSSRSRRSAAPKLRRRNPGRPSRPFSFSILSSGARDLRGPNLRPERRRTAETAEPRSVTADFPFPWRVSPRACIGSGFTGPATSTRSPSMGCAHGNQAKAQ